MVNKYSESIFSLATSFTNNFAKDSRISAVFLGGSGSRNLADKYSDIEIYIIWNIDTDNEIRKSILNSTDYEILYPEEHDEPSEWTITVLIGGIKYDIYHWGLAQAESLLMKANSELVISLSEQCSISAILDAKVIKGEEYINELKGKFSIYPEEIVEPLIKQNLFFESWGSREVLLDRKDYLALSLMVNQYIVQLLCVLFAINRVYLRSTNFKWLNYQDGLLKNKPSELVDKIQFIETNLNHAGLNKLDELMCEVISLTKKFCPEIELSVQKKVFEYNRKYVK